MHGMLIYTRITFTTPRLDKRLARLNSRSSVLAVVGGTLGDGLGLVAGGGALELLADGLDRRSAGVGDGGGSTKVGVDTGEQLAVGRLDVLDDDAAGDRVLAVTAGTVKLAKVGDLESIDGDGTLAVAGIVSVGLEVMEVDLLLDDLVLGSLGSSADDVGVAGVVRYVRGVDI
jgi:hypothetical protein